MRRQASDGAYLGGTLSLPDDVPTGDLDVVQKLLFMRDGPLRSAPMDALITLAQQMRTARFEPRAGLGQIGARPGSCT
jgi:hypothetical protein